MKNIRKDIGWSIRHALAIALWAFILASIAGFFSQTVVKTITMISVAFFLLFVVILIGVVFDIIGVAVTVANESSLHARAANRVVGAAQAVRLVKNASRVASFCNDVVGDVCGTLSGAIGITILFQITTTSTELLSVLIPTLITALIAACAVGGKALGKTFAIEWGTVIVLKIGYCLAWQEKLLPFLHLATRKNKGNY